MDIDSRIKQQHASNVADGIADECAGSVDCLLGIACHVRRAQGNALHPGRGEEVYQVEADNASSSHRIGQFPPDTG